MIEILNNFLNLIYLLKNLTIKDTIDISLLSLIIFFILYSFLESKFFKVIRGILVISFIFFISNWYNLALTKTFFQTFFNVILIIIVLIFQQEIRKALEKFSFNITKPKNIISKKEILIDSMIKCLNFFSENKIGALLVFENNDNLRPYIQNEIRLNSDLSCHLLISIFNKESPLHDGAVIINKSKIKYGGAHLPLGEEYNDQLKRGTRHRAGTIITSETDAFSIIVSEETGKISLAENGKLNHNVSIDKIISRLNYYFDNNKSKLKDIIIGDFLYKSFIKLFLIFILSLSISFSFWIFSNYNKAKLQKIVEIPIEFKNLKDELTISSPSNLKAKMTLSAFETEFKFFDETKSRLIIDLKDFDEGIYNISLIKENIINIPKTIEIINIEPKLIKFKLVPKATETSQTKNNN